MKGERNIPSAMALVAASMSLTFIPTYAKVVPQWAYQGQSGPSSWHQLASEYQTCLSGQHQSPVNITPSTPYSSTVVEARYQPSTLFIFNDGHTVQENFTPGSGLVSNGREYALVQMHLHTPSEHALSGKRYPLAVHFVHADAQNNLAYLAVFFEVGEANAELAKIIDAAPRRAEPTRRFAGVQVDPAGLLPASLDTYNYMGSLTRPPCTEDVNWHVLKTVMTASMDQVEVLHAILGDNARPLQNGDTHYASQPVVQVAAEAQSIEDAEHVPSEDHYDVAVAHKAH